MKHLHFQHRAGLSQSEWEAWASHLMAEGRFFSAYEKAQQGLQQFPESRILLQIKARALMRTGGLEEAKTILEGLLPPLLVGQESMAGMLQSFQEKVSAAAPPQLPAQQFLETAVSALQELLQAWQCRYLASGGQDEETIGLLARICKDLWKRSGNLAEARQSCSLYDYGYCSTGGYWTGINAATMSLLTGEPAKARELAQQVVARCQSLLATAKPAELYWLQATIGEGYLLLGQPEAAVAAYQQAAAYVNGNYDYIVSSRQQFRLLQRHGILVPAAIAEALQPPTVVIMTGHMRDQPGRDQARFPAALVPAVQAALAQELAALDAKIGFCSAACGADLLFLEAMRERGARVNVVLPFQVEDFRRTSVAFAGPAWVHRFHDALKLADSVRYVTDEGYLGDDVLFRFTNQVLQGLAALHAHRLDTTPHLLAVWDGVASAQLGGTADMIAAWPDPQRCRIIQLADLHAAANAPKLHQVQAAAAAAPVPPLPASEPGPRRRVIKTLLFADIQQFAKIAEEHLPFYVYEFLESLAAAAPPPPGLINTWGDAIFVALDAALPLLDYAFALLDAVMATDWRQVGLPGGLQIRIALHAGPVFQAADALTGRQNLYGAHVNRAARLEPRTPPPARFTPVNSSPPSWSPNRRRPAAGKLLTPIRPGGMSATMPGLSYSPKTSAASRSFTSAGCRPMKRFIYRGQGSIGGG